MIRDWSARLSSSLTKSQSWQGHSKRAHVGIILHPNEHKQMKLLLIKRSEREEDPWSGHIALPGGRPDHPLENPFEVTCREVREETGLELSEELWQGGLSPLNHPSLAVGAEIFLIDQNIRSEQLRPCEQEVEVIFSVLLEELLRPDFKTEVSWKNHSMPGVQLEYGILWGLTYRLLTELFSLCEGLPLDSSHAKPLGLKHWVRDPF